MPEPTQAMATAGTRHFISACDQVLRFLKQRTGFDSWFINRVQDGQLIALTTLGWSTDGQGAAVLCPVEDSYCHLMLNDRAPRCAPDLHAVPAYHNAAINKSVTLGAYVGVPLISHDGSVVGTLCAAHPTPLPASVHAELPLIELQGQLLSLILTTELEADRNRRRAEQAEAASTHDALTGLYNRRAWDVLLDSEESRCTRYAHAACVLSIDLDDLKLTNDRHGHTAGDDLIRRSAKALLSAVRDTDAVARLGGDEFAVLAPECDTAHAAIVLDRVHRAFETAKVRASVGIGHRETQGTLAAASDAADEAMYVVKRARKLKERWDASEIIAV